MNYAKVMDRLMEAEVQEGRVAGVSALVLKDGQEVYYNNFGFADKEAGKPMKRDTICRMFSMSKPITAAAVMIAQEKGYLDLLDPVSKYLPEYGSLQVLSNDGTTSAVTNPMTLMHLMTMTSGIPYGENWEGCSAAGLKMQELFDRLEAEQNAGKRLSTREMAAEFAKCPLAFQPGERWMYGLSADVLGAVVEAATGVEYSEFLKREIFNPLQMVDTGFFVPEEKRDRFAMSYEYDGEGKLIPKDDNHLCVYYREDVAFKSGGAGLVSTIDDYSRFAQMLCNGGTFRGKRILGKKSVAFLSKNHLTTEQAWAMDWDSNRGYGYGCLMRVLVNQTKGGTQAPLGEFGWDGWTGNYVTMDPEDNLVLLYFIQLRGAGTTPVVRKLRAATFSNVENL